VVLEILENVEPTALAIDQVRELAELGYRVALDDFVFGSPQVEFMPYVKIVKVDLTENKGRLLNQTVDMLKKCRVKLLAEKVETLAMYNQCQVLGFHYFQGYFCAKPEIVSGKTVPAQVTTLVNLLNRIQDADISLAELESLIAPDLGLTYRLLRMVNSVSINPNDVVDSLRSALLILGIERVRSLASLLALAAMDATPDELMVTAMVRAKMCESIAPLMGHRDPSRHFTVGLLSVLDKILDMPMAEILNQIPLSPELKAALADESAQGPLRETLALAEAFEAGNWQLIESNYSDRPEVSECYLDAVEWADRTATTIAA
jgi:EAL and modified HD-GYP domain-containing signal transduction protein